MNDPLPQPAESAEPGPAAHRRGGRSDLARLASVVAIVGLIVWFALTNRQRVRVDFLVTTRDIRLIVVIVLSAVFGLAVGWLLGRRRARR